MDKNLTTELLSLYVYKGQDKPKCKHYMPIEWMGKKWISATDAHQVIIIEENDLNKIEPPTEQTVDVVRILPEFNCAVDIDINFLKRHYDKIPIVKDELTESCDACDGDGKFEHYGEWYDCKTCDYTGECGSGIFKDIPDPSHIFKVKELFLQNKHIKNLLTVIKASNVKNLTMRYQNNSGITLFQLDNSIFVGISSILKDRLEEMDEKTIIEI